MIFLEDNAVKVGELTLPGIFKSMEIDGSALIEEQEIEGNGKKPKQATGWEDATVKIELTISNTDNQTAADKIKSINNIFKPTNQQVPQIQNIVSEHTAARGISKVLFKNLTTKETNNDDNITVTLEFVEYYPVAVTVKKAAKSSSKSSNTSGSAVSSSSRTRAVRTTSPTKGSIYSGMIQKETLLSKLKKAPSVNKTNTLPPPILWTPPGNAMNRLSILGVDK